MRIFLLSIIVLFVSSCKNYDDKIILTKNQSKDNLKAKCEQLKVDGGYYRYSDCDCIVNAVSNNTGLRGMVGFNHVIFQYINASDITLDILGAGMYEEVGSDTADMIATDISNCCECDSELCSLFMVILQASHSENFRASDLSYNPPPYSSFFKKCRGIVKEKVKEKSDIVTININENSDILVSYGAHDRFLTIEELRTHCEFLIEHRGVEKDYSGNYITPLIFSVITNNATKYEDYVAVLDQLKEANYIHPESKKQIDITKISIANPSR